MFKVSYWREAGSDQTTTVKEGGLFLAYDNISSFLLLKHNKVG